MCSFSVNGFVQAIDCNVKQHIFQSINFPNFMRTLKSTVVLQKWVREGGKREGRIEG